MTTGYEQRRNAIFQRTIFETLLRDLDRILIRKYNCPRFNGLLKLRATRSCRTCQLVGSVQPLQSIFRDRKGKITRNMIGYETRDVDRQLFG